MESRRWSFARSPAAHLLLRGPVPNGPEVGDPCSNGRVSFSTDAAQMFKEEHARNCVVGVKWISKHFIKDTYSFNCKTIRKRIFFYSPLHPTLVFQRMAAWAGLIYFGDLAVPVTSLYVTFPWIEQVLVLHKPLPIPLIWPGSVIWSKPLPPLCSTANTYLKLNNIPIKIRKKI